MKHLLLSLILFGSFCYKGDLWVVGTNKFANTYEVMLVEISSDICLKQTI